MTGLKRWVALVATALGLLVLTPAAAQARWLRAESPRFIVYTDRGESVLREYVQQMALFDSLLRARHGERGFPTVETQSLMITAYKQAPQVEEVRFELIQILMARRRWREAEALLRPLVNSPHGGDVAEKARELMKRVQAALAAA